jgi:anaerobic ribonucleoside-triphosphate reductase activating protein
MKYLKITSPDINNGPGFRVTLWLPGCQHNCKGCHNQWTHDYNQGEEFTEDTYATLMDILKRPYITGLTISGGDPLYQSNNVLSDLYELITKVRTEAPDKTVWLYTGFKYEDLVGIQMEIANICHVIVDGPYIEELRDVSLPFRGSSNQRIIHIHQQMSKEEAESKYIIKEQNNINMRKSIFKGTINGQEFDNVNDYNARMNELISAGAEIEAASSTQIPKSAEDECTSCECESKCEEGPACCCEPDCNCGCECACTDKCSEGEMLPIFQKSKFTSIGEFLDGVITEDRNLNESALDQLSEYLHANHKHIQKAINTMDGHALENYKKDLVGIINDIKSCITENNKIINRVRKKLLVLGAGSDVLDILLDEYRCIIGEVDEKILAERKVSSDVDMEKLTEAVRFLSEIFGHI